MTAPITLTAFEDRLFADLPEGELRDALAARGLPTRRTEAWRWSDLRAALRDERAASDLYEGPDPAPLLDLPGAVTLTCRNGEWDVPALPDGLRVSLDAPRPAILPDADLASLATTARVLTVEVDGAFGAPLIVRRLSDGQGTHASRLDLRLAAHGRARLVETHEAAGAPFANALTELELGTGARLDRAVIQPEASGVIVHTTLACLSDDAELSQTTLALGADLCRHEARLTHGRASRARLDALYRVDGQRHCDVTTHVVHTNEGAVTDQLTRGVALGRGRGVFQGKFLVERGAQATDAKMAHDALILSAGAQVNAKPELEIYADDVECAHGNTVGALDPEALFYLRQRGLGEGAARGVLVDAFAAAVLDRVAGEDVRTRLEALFREAT